MYTHVTIEVAYGRLSLFLETMPKVQAIVEQAGWILKQALIQQNGRLFTVVHVWKLRDMNNYAEGIDLLLGHAEYPALIEALASVVLSETIVFAVDAPYAPA